MKPGVPFDVLLTKIRNEKFALQPHVPEGFVQLHQVPPRVPANADVVSYYSTFAPPTVAPSTRFTTAMPRGDKGTWDVEEFVAMQFAYIRALAENAAGERVKDVVVTVPPFYSQFERDAMADAVELSGLRLLALVNDGAAVAVNYAMTRQFPKPERHIVYDAGAASTRATVATQWVGYDRLAGGTELDRRLREILIGEFEHKHGEAERVKAILSANTEASSRVESVYNDIDFGMKVTRQAFENICADMKVRFVQPIYDALDNANLTLADIDSVILTGGASRIPIVRAALVAAVGEEKLAMNVNSDEAAVLGAALHGATLSRQFRTKNIKLSDIAPYDIQVSYLAEAKSTDVSGVPPRTITSTAFARGSRTGTRKTLTWRFPTELLDARISGIAEALANITEAGGVDPVIKVTILFSESGFVSVPEAIATQRSRMIPSRGRLKISSVTAQRLPLKMSHFNRGFIFVICCAQGHESGGHAKGHHNPLNVTVKFTSVAPMGLEEKREARQRLIKMEAEEAAIAAREEQRNILEGYLYKMRDLLESDSQHTFVKCSQESERRAISRQLKDVSNWFNTHADEAQTKDFREKRLSLEALERPIVHRVKEIEEFPQVLNISQMWNWNTRLFLADARTNLTAEEQAGTTGRYTKTELDELEKTLKEHESWLDEWVEKQRSVPMNHNPVIETAEMRKRANVLETHLQRLVLKKIPRVRPTSTSGTTTQVQVPVRTDEPGTKHDEL
ncbi:Hsp70 protein-domain-containing protein [Multifurca ochricompacta]|uniref:Hsp70 protein-domain-containing protein n=1 Tax=Multifurca ochricompacta TaxID=376703 RepID=A0AAD4M2K1_9AGAM|nr:Hsp70 protein-domain-containing protein [Multifurca ochricompacta]